MDFLLVILRIWFSLAPTSAPPHSLRKFDTLHTSGHQVTYPLVYINVCVCPLQVNCFSFVEDFLFALACALDWLTYLYPGCLAETLYIFLWRNSSSSGSGSCLTFACTVNWCLLWVLYFLFLYFTVFSYTYAPASSYQWNFEVFITLQILFRQ